MSKEQYLFRVFDNTSNKPLTAVLASKTKLTAIDLACEALGFDASARGSALDFFKTYSIVEEK